MKIKLLLILISIISCNCLKAQELYLSGTYEVTFNCDDAAVYQYKLYYVFDGIEEEHGFIEYHPTMSKTKYYAATLGNYNLSETTLTIELTTNAGSGNLMHRIVNGKLEPYTVKKEFVLKSIEGDYIILGNDKECKNFKMKLRELNENELEDFYNNLN